MRALNLRLVAIVGMTGLFLASCTTLDRVPTMNGKPAGAIPPAPVESVANVPKNQSTYHYTVTIYPGLDENFDPNPALTLKEYNELTQLDWYCARETDKLRGRYQEMAKQGVTYGILEGMLGMAGTVIGFGSAVRPLDYLAQIGLTSAGGGLANGTQTFDLALAVVHGYCMTGMVYKADELERKLRRIFIVPMYVGHADLPAVSDKPAPSFPYARSGETIVPPPGM